MEREMETQDYRVVRLKDAQPEDKIKFAEQANRIISREYLNYAGKLAEKEKELDNCQTQLRASQAEVQRKVQTMRFQMEELENVNHMLRASEAKVQRVQRMAHLHKVEASEKELEKQKRKISELEKMMGDAEQMSARKLAKKEKELENSETQHRNSEAKIQEMRLQMKELEDVNKFSQAKVQTMSSQMGIERIQHTTQLQKVEALNKELEKQKRKISELEQRMGDAEQISARKLANKEKELENSETQLKDSKTKIQEMRFQMKELQDITKAYQAKAQTMRSLMSIQRTQHTAQLQKVEALNKELEKQERKISELNQEKQVLEDVNKASQAKVQTMSSQMSIERTQHTTQLQKVEALKKELEKQKRNISELNQVLWDDVTKVANDLTPVFEFIKAITSRNDEVSKKVGHVLAETGSKLTEAQAYKARIMHLTNQQWATAGIINRKTVVLTIMEVLEAEQLARQCKARVDAVALIVEEWKGHIASLVQAGLPSPWAPDGGFLQEQEFRQLVEKRRNDELSLDSSIKDKVTRAVKLVVELEERLRGVVSKVVHISEDDWWEHEMRYCQLTNARLPSEGEWKEVRKLINKLQPQSPFQDPSF